MVDDLIRPAATTCIVQIQSFWHWKTVDIIIWNISYNYIHISLKDTISTRIKCKEKTHACQLIFSDLNSLKKYQVVTSCNYYKSFETICLCMFR